MSMTLAPLQREVGRSYYITVLGVECSRSSALVEHSTGHLNSAVHSWMVPDLFPIWIAGDNREVGGLPVTSHDG